MRLRLPALLASAALIGSTAVLGQPAAAGATVPSVVLTSPEDNSAIWGEDLTLSADATPADSGEEVVRVDFYLDARDTRTQPTPFRTDDTYPYEVSVPIADLGWEILRSHKVTAVAVDKAGRSSSHPASAGAVGTSWVTIGPPPVLDWTTPPAAPPTVAGSTTGGVRVEYAAALDDIVPASGENDFFPPRISKVENLLDGVVVHAWQPAGAQRTVSGPAVFYRHQGLTGGHHRVGVAVTVWYASDTVRKVIEADVFVADGTRLTGPVMAGTRVVGDGFVVTAGDYVGFRVPLEAAVPGTYLRAAHMDISHGDGAPTQGLAWRDFACGEPRQCVASATLDSGTSGWAVPDKPGRATLTIQSGVFGDRYATVVERSVVIQPAANLTAVVSRNTIRRGRAVVVTGRLIRRDNGAPQTGRVVRVQRRQGGTGRWVTVATRTTDRYGRVRARMRPVRSGAYRLVSPAVAGALGRGLSPARWVAVRR